MARTLDDVQARAGNRRREFAGALDGAEPVAVAVDDHDRPADPREQRTQVARAVGEHVAEPDLGVGLHHLAPELAHHPHVGCRPEEGRVELLPDPAADDVAQLRDGRVGNRRYRGGADGRNRAHAGGVQDGGRERDVPAKAVTDEDRRRGREALEHASEQRGRRLDRRRPFEPARTPVPREVDRERTVVGAEVHDRATPESRAAALAVQEDQGRAPVEARRRTGQRHRAGVGVVDRRPVVEVEVLGRHEESCGPGVSSLPKPAGRLKRQR